MALEIVYLFQLLQHYLCMLKLNAVNWTDVSCSLFTVQINTQYLDNFLVRMEQGYSKHGNPYHNLIHAADVTQTTHAIITQSGLAVSKQRSMRFSPVKSSPMSPIINVINHIQREY